MKRRTRFFNRAVLVTFSGCLCTVLAGAVLFAGCDIKTDSRAESAQARVVARVNGQPIYEYQLKPLVDQGLHEFEKIGMRKESPDVILHLQERALEKVIGEELIYQESKKFDVQDIDAKIAGRLQVLKEGYETEEEFKHHLRVQHLTEQQLRQAIQRDVYIREYLASRGIAAPEIPEEFIRQFYDNNPDAYYRKEAIRASQILVAVPENAGAAERQRALQKAREIRGNIVSGGVDFGKIARKYSACKSAAAGGRMGLVERGTMPPQFDKVAFAMETDTISDIVATELGYHIIKVQDKIPAGKIPYEQARESIKRFFQEQESAKMLTAYVQKLKGNASIEILLTQAPTNRT